MPRKVYFREMLWSLNSHAQEMPGWVRVCQKADQEETEWRGVVVSKFRIGGILHTLFVLSPLGSQSDFLEFGLVRSAEIVSDGTLEVPVTTRLVVYNMVVYATATAAHDSLRHHASKIRAGIALVFEEAEEKLKLFRQFCLQYCPECVE